MQFGRVAMFCSTAVLATGLLVAAQQLDSPANSALRQWHSEFEELPLRKQVCDLDVSFGTVRGIRTIAFCTGLLVLLSYAAWGFWSYFGGNKILLLDFHGFQIPEHLKRTRRQIIDSIRQANGISNEGIELHKLVLESSGIGDGTGLPDGFDRAVREKPIKRDLEDALSETCMVIFNIATEVLQKADIQPQEVDIVIVSSSAFAPTPSVAAMIVNKFKMRSDVLTYNFSGMGDSASVVCVDLARHILTARPNSLALVINHENVTSNWYNGNDRSLMVTNCLFRLGGAAVLLSNRPRDLRTAKYELKTLLRTHLGSQDDAFGCMGVAEDPSGYQGTFLKKNVMEVLDKALNTNVRRLAPRILPQAELARAAGNREYMAHFSKAFQHVLLHTGGRGILDNLEINLGLTAQQAQPSKDTLLRFGNTSAASTWYILAGIEHTAGIKKGDRVWQLGFGGGFKCNSAVWQARKNIKQEHSCWA